MARIAERARAAIARLIEEMSAEGEPEIEVWTLPPDALGRTFYPPSCETATVGAAIVPALRLGWSLLLSPGDDRGRLWRQSAGQEFERARLRDPGRQTRIF